MLSFTYSDPLFSFYLFGSFFLFTFSDPFFFFFFLFTFVDPFFFCLPFWIRFFLLFLFTFLDQLFRLFTVPFRIVRMTEKARTFHLTASPCVNTDFFLCLGCGSFYLCCILADLHSREREGASQRVRPHPLFLLARAGRGRNLPSWAAVRRALLARSHRTQLLVSFRRLIS